MTVNSVNTRVPHILKTEQNTHRIDSKKYGKIYYFPFFSNKIRTAIRYLHVAAIIHFTRQQFRGKSLRPILPIRGQC